MNNYQQPYYSQPMQDNLNQLRNQYQQPKIQDDRIWIQGEIGAKAYLVASGNTVTLWDSESPTIWIKSVDLNGIPQMQKLTYALENQAQKAPILADNIDMSKYLTIEEFERRMAEMKEKKEAEYDK